jgi:hypothetical protein
LPPQAGDHCSVLHSRQRPIKRSLVNIVIKEMPTRPARREQTTLSNVIAIDAGVPIKVGNDVIGGVGLSGSPGVDEPCVNGNRHEVPTSPS